MDSSLIRMRMFVPLLLIVIWAPRAQSRGVNKVSMYQNCEQWMAHFGRVYVKDGEQERRFEIFNNNVKFIESFNGGYNRTYKLSINGFTDQINEEFQAYHNGLKMRSSLISSQSLSLFRYGNATGLHLVWTGERNKQLRTLKTKNNVVGNNLPL